MALEDWFSAGGYTMVPNWLIGAVMAHQLGKHQMLVLLVVLRLTSGFGKTSDDLSLTQLASHARMDTGNVSRAVRELVAKGFLSREPGRFGHRIGVQIPPHGVVDSTIGGVVESTMQGLLNQQSVSIYQKKLPKEEYPPNPPYLGGVVDSTTPGGNIFGPPPQGGNRQGGSDLITAPNTEGGNRQGGSDSITDQKRKGLKDGRRSTPAAHSPQPRTPAAPSESEELGWGFTGEGF
ncbi:MAG: replication protein [Nitrospirota bacterium]|nr:replication protein [Nitrospirota bacterium]